MKTKNQLQNLEKLSRFVYKLNYADETSEDYVYYQIIKYLAEYGSFKTTQLDKKFNIEKQIDGKRKKIQIERRKLKSILDGNDKDFIGLIPLGYVMAVPEMKNRGGHQENTYYLTEKGIMASIGFHSYKKNINLNKILYHYKLLGKRYKKFISKFIKLQIQTCLAYHYVQGISLGFKKEHIWEYDMLRSYLIRPFEIRIENENLEQQFNDILKELNTYRKIHLRLFKENSFFGFLWEESQYVTRNIFPEHGFHGWYQLQFLTMLDDNLKQIRHKSRRNVESSRSKSDTTVTAIGEPQFLYSLLQDKADNISDETIENTMKLLGIIRRRRAARQYHN